MQVLPLSLLLLILSLLYNSQKLSLFLQFFEIRENKIREIISFQLYNIKVCVCVCVCVAIGHQ